MAAIDSSPDAPGASKTAPLHTRPLVQFSLIFSVMLAVGALVVTGAVDGWRAAAESVSRFSVIAFVLALAVEPLARIFPTQTLRAIGREHDGFMLAFVAAFAVSLVCVLAPSALGTAQFSIPAVFYATLNGVVLTVLVLSTEPVTIGFLNAHSWRAMQRIATGFYWLAFTMWDLGRLGTTGIADSWYGFSLFLLIGVIVIRLADWFVARQRARELAEKVG